jgi:hypothetical protein
MKVFSSPAALLVQGAIIAIGSALMSTPVMAQQATASGAFVTTSPAGYVESYSGELTLPRGYYFGGLEGSDNSELRVEIVDMAATAGTTDPNTGAPITSTPARRYLSIMAGEPVATGDDGYSGSFEVEAARALRIAVDGYYGPGPQPFPGSYYPGQVFGPEQIDAIAAIIKAGAGVDGLE